jgi:hypothetical protein
MWHSEVEKVVMEMKDAKTMGDGDVPGDVLKLLAEGGLKIMKQLVNNMCKTGGWPKDVLVAVTVLEEKPKAKKCSDFCTASYYVHYR